MTACCIRSASTPSTGDVRFGDLGATHTALRAASYLGCQHPFGRFRWTDSTCHWRPPRMTVQPSAPREAQQALSKVAVQNGGRDTIMRAARYRGRHPVVGCSSGRYQVQDMMSCWVPKSCFPRLWLLHDGGGSTPQKCQPKWASVAPPGYERWVGPNPTAAAGRSGLLWTSLGVSSISGFLKGSEVLIRRI